MVAHHLKEKIYLSLQKFFILMYLRILAKIMHENLRTKSQVAT